MMTVRFHPTQDPARRRNPPGGGGESDDQGLKQAPDVGEGIFVGEDEVKERQQDETMDEKSRQDRDEVHA